MFLGDQLGTPDEKFERYQVFSGFDCDDIGLNNVGLLLLKKSCHYPVAGGFEFFGSY